MANIISMEKKLVAENVHYVLISGRTLNFIKPTSPSRFLQTYASQNKVKIVNGREPHRVMNKVVSETVDDISISIYSTLKPNPTSPSTIINLERSKVQTTHQSQWDTVKGNEMSGFISSLQNMQGLHDLELDFTYLFFEHSMRQMKFEILSIQYHRVLTWR